MTTKKYIKFVQENPETIRKVMESDPTLSVNLAIAFERGIVKKDMSKVKVGDYFITKSNRLSKVVAIGPIVELEGYYDEEEEVWHDSGHCQVIVFKDCLGNRLWSYSLTDSDSWIPTEGEISSGLSVHEYQVVDKSIKNGYLVDIPLSGSNPTKLSHLMSDGTFLAIVGKSIKRVHSEQYGVSMEA